MSLSVLNEELNRQILTVCKYLLGNGKLGDHGREWKVGDFDNTESKDRDGGSACVCVSGANIGKWHDFANPDDRGGNLVQLWARVKRVDFKVAYQQCAEFVHLDVNLRSRPKPRTSSKRYNLAPLTCPKSVRKPKDESPVTAFFRQRGITEETMLKLQVGEELNTVRFNGDKRLVAVGGEDSLVHAAVFPYKDIHGNLTFIKYRNIYEKSFRAEANRTPILFGWQSIDFNKPYLIITEGELDQMSWTQYGFNALSVPFGAGDKDKNEWIEHDYDHLQFFSEIYLSLDGDDVGIAARNDIARRLGSDFDAERFLTIKQIQLPFKDANECLMQGITLEKMQECFDNAEPMNFDDEHAICQLSDFRETLLKPKEDGLRGQRGEYLPWSALDNLFRLRPREVTLWGGYSGHGKTHLLFHIMLHLMYQGARVLVASLEMPAETCGDYLIYQAGGTAKPTTAYKDCIIDWYDDKLWLVQNAKLKNAKLETLLQQFGYCAKKYGVTHFVLDCISAMEYRSDDYDAQRGIIQQCKMFANRHNAHVHLVSHVRKNISEHEIPTKSDIKDSTAWTDLSDNTVVIWRNKPKELASAEGENYRGPKVIYDCDTVLKVEKQRMTGCLPLLKLWSHPETGQWLQNDYDKPRRYVPFKGVVEEGIASMDDIPDNVRFLDSAAAGGFAVNNEDII